MAFSAFKSLNISEYFRVIVYMIVGFRLEVTIVMAVFFASVAKLRLA